MIAPDPFSQYYSKPLDTTYDVVDRIVLNLDNTHLMRMAGRFSRRVRGWAKKHSIPVAYCAAGERKHKTAEELRPTDPNFRGIFAVLIGKAPAPAWEVLRFESGGFHVRHKKALQYVNRYSFHIIDEEWGHVTIEIYGHAPFKGSSGNLVAERGQVRRPVAMLTASRP